MKTLKVKKMDVDDFIRDDKSAAVFLNEMIKLDSGDGSMVRLAIGNIIKCHNVSEIAKTACVSRASLYSAFNKDCYGVGYSICAVGKSLNKGC